MYLTAVRNSLKVVLIDCVLNPRFTLVLHCVNPSLSLCAGILPREERFMDISSLSLFPVRLNSQYGGMQKEVFFIMQRLHLTFTDTDLHFDQITCRRINERGARFTVAKTWESLCCLFEASFVKAN